MSFYNYFISHKRTKRYQLILNAVNRRIIGWIAPYLKTNFLNVVLEIGIGQGEICKLMRNRDNIQYIGLDINYNICHANRINDCPNIQSKIPAIPIKDRQVDMIYMSHVIEHLGSYDMILDFFKEVRRVLKPDGYLVLLFPDYLSWKQDFYNIDYSHNFPMTIKRLQNLAKDGELEICRLTDYCGPFLGWKGRLFKCAGKMFPFKTAYALNPVKFSELRKSGYVFNTNIIAVLKKRN